MNPVSSLSLALDVLSKLSDNTKRGPQGGDLERPLQPEARRASFNGGVNEATGLPGLHRFGTDKAFKDSSVVGFKNEQAWHRMAAFMILAGRTNSEIGMAAGVTAQTVSVLRAQRWFQELLATLANEQGQDLQAAITTHAHDAINRLAEIASGDVKEYGVRNVLTASLAIIDHAKGKATQTILSSVSHSSMEASEEMASIQQQLAALRSSAERTAAPQATMKNITPVGDGLLSPNA
jgi:hypothetical protein